MNELQPIQPQDRAPAPQPLQSHCDYCGAKLSAFYYFCVRCGTPFRHHSANITAAAPIPLTESQLIERKAPHVWRMFGVFLGTLIVSGITAGLLFWEKEPALGMAVQMTALFIVTCVYAAIHWRTLVVQFKQFGMHHGVAWLGILALLPLLLVNFGYHSALQALLDADATSELDDLRKDGVGQATIIFIYCVFPAVTEEIAFRGLIQHWLQTAIRPVRALMLASGLFAIMHVGAVLSWPYLFAVGCVLGWTKWKTRSLYPAMIIHLVHNYVAIELFS